ncbi:MAG TPA: RNA polymerase-binding protein RbpA [Actinomycetales bacterium]|jgi:hypothetical protein
MSDKSLRGTRLGAHSLESDEGVEPAARRVAQYTCARGHTTRVPFSVEAEAPSLWECKCGEEALLVDSERPTAKFTKPARTHWDMLLERRSVAELEVLLDERLALLRAAQRPAAKVKRSA